jgi:hypothetical protein
MFGKAILEIQMKSLRSLPVLSLTIMGFLLAVTAAKADTFLFSVDSSLQYAVAGDTLTYDASVTNLDPVNEVWLNSVQFTSLDPPLTDDTDPFLNNFPLTLSFARGTFYGEMFDITVPVGTAPGDYVGWVEVLGGVNSDSMDVLGSPQSITVDVMAGAPSPAPEPSTFLLLLTGMAGLAGTFRRRLAR